MQVDLPQIINCKEKQNAKIASKSNCGINEIIALYCLGHVSSEIHKSFTMENYCNYMHTCTTASSLNATSMCLHLCSPFRKQIIIHASAISMYTRIY